MDAGEVQLILAWEQGEDYKEVRVLGFLLEFWHDGVRDALTQVESKRSFEKYIAHMIEQRHSTKTKNCSLAQGRRLLLDALAVNKKHGTTPHRDYRLNLSLINQLILEVPDLEEDDRLFDEVDEDEDFDENDDFDAIDLFKETGLFNDEDDEDEDEDINLHDLNPVTVISLFIEYHIAGKFGVSYDLLAQDSPLREGLTKEEWIERRKLWEQEANPGDVEPNFIFRQDCGRKRRI